MTFCEEMFSHLLHTVWLGRWAKYSIESMAASSDYQEQHTEEP